MPKKLIYSSNMDQLSTGSFTDSSLILIEESLMMNKISNYVVIPSVIMSNKYHSLLVSVNYSGKLLKILHSEFYWSQLHSQLLSQYSQLQHKNVLMPGLKDLLSL